MMQHNHRDNTRRIEPIELVAITVKLTLVQFSIGFSLQPRPFNTGSIRIHPQFAHPLDVFDISVVAVASNTAGAAIAGDKVGPFVVDMPFDLSRGGRDSPQKPIWESQRVAVV